MGDSTDGRTDGPMADGPAEDFLRGGTETATARGTDDLLDRLGDAPDRLQYAAATAGAVLAVLVAWSTWTSPGYGAAVAVLAGLAVFAASVVAVNVGYVAGG